MRLVRADKAINVLQGPGIGICDDLCGISLCAVTTI